MTCRYCDQVGPHDRRVCHMKWLHANPEWAERRRVKNRALMKALHADPAFVERNRERSRIKIAKLHADPGYIRRRLSLPLTATDQQVVDYRLLRRKGLSIPEARAAVLRLAAAE